ncbi:hypothetical protein O1611_g4525 [Lasiodiplodia mahajangana]|uniref:Uncharacterized protein n=1 Tax=Lasiodiplodia mahajangana TaxID=1108764 RepID=A0ACC2JNV9_9PEZI|nr:hypothetical protein O1611_g4525 [Lasiodiplodia mahajangana]
MLSQPPTSSCSGPALESQTERKPGGLYFEILNWLLPYLFNSNDPVIPDAVEYLLARESSFEQASLLPTLRLIAREYNRIRERCARSFHQPDLFERAFGGDPSTSTKEIFSCDSLLCHWSFVSPADARVFRPDLNVDNGNNGARTRVEPNDTVSNWACRVALLAQTWGIELMPWSPNSGPRNAHEFTRPKPFLPPSMRAPHNWSLQLPQNHQSRIQWGKDLRLPGNLDPTRGNNEIFFLWQSGCTPFVSDLAVHIFEHHKSTPTSEYAKIIVCPPSSKDGEFRLVISFRSCRANVLFANQRDNAVDPEIEISQAHGLQRQWWPMKEAVLSLCCVFEVIVIDTADFVRDCHEQTSRIHIIGRKSPSASKLRFLFHLEDLRQASQAGVQHALEVLDLLARWMSGEGCNEVSIDGRVFHDKLTTIARDLEFLNQELDELKLNIEKDRKILGDHFQLEQGSTVFRLSVLAAIFLPLSFTTSLFGMNIDQGILEGPQGFHEYTNATLDGLPPDIRNPTEALVSILGVNSNFSFTWIAFGVTAASLLVTLPLSLFLGAIARAIVVSAAKYAAYWRVITIIAATGLITFSILATYIDYRLIIIINVPLILIFAWNTYRAWILNQRPLVWTSVVVITTAFFFADLFQRGPLGIIGLYSWEAFHDRGSETIPFMIIPWAYIGLVYLIPWLRKRRLG